MVYNCDSTSIMENMTWTSWGADGANGAVPAKKSGCDAEPECQSCVKMTPPARCTASVTADQPRIWASVNSPGTSCQPMASRLIHVPSVMSNPAEARWVSIAAADVTAWQRTWLETDPVADAAKETLLSPPVT